MSSTKPTINERLQASVAHISILFFGVGILVCLVLWMIQRKKSGYVTFQSLQALGWQIFQVIYTTLIALIGLIISLTIFSIMGGPSAGTARLSSTGIIDGIIHFFLIGLYILPALVGTVACLIGKNFHYPWLGQRLAVYLSYTNSVEQGSRMEEEHEDRWMAAISNLSASIPFTGILVPMMIWANSYKERPWLRFQSIQATLYQVVGMVLYLFAVILIGVMFIIGIFAVAQINTPSTLTDDQSIIIIMIPFLLSMIAFTGVLLIIPVYSTLPLVAAYRILKGKDYFYPIIGKFIQSHTY